MEDDGYLRTPLNPEQRTPDVRDEGSGQGTSSSSGFVSLASLKRASPMSWFAKMKQMDVQELLRYMRYANVILATLQAFAGFLGLFDLVVLDITTFLISAYVIIFALLLLAFECRFTSMEPQLREQFGFLFTYSGRTTFVFMVGFMDFGMDVKLAWFVGVLMCANAVLACLIMFFHHDFRNGHLSPTSDPTVTYDPASKETAHLMHEHPEYAAKIGRFVTGYAQEHPDVVSEALRHSAQQPRTMEQGYVPPTPVA